MKRSAFLLLEVLLALLIVSASGVIFGAHWMQNMIRHRHTLQRLELEPFFTSATAEIVRLYAKNSPLLESHKDKVQVLTKEQLHVCLHDGVEWQCSYIFHSEKEMDAEYFAPLFLQIDFISDKAEHHYETAFLLQNKKFFYAD